MQIILLTHEREVTRPSNTGQLALNAFPNYCQRVIWARTAPDEALINLLQSDDCALLFPGEAQGEQTDAAMQPLSGIVDKNSNLLPKTVVILDATWQEARKMIRRSEYLKDARKYSLSSQKDSQFTLRRNQVEGGLCTVECIIELFKLANMHTEAQLLVDEFALVLS